MTHVDVLIVGAGLSGIGAACHLQTDAPRTSYAILEARGASGGTWGIGALLRFVQVGNLQAYSFFFGLGVVALIYFAVFR